MDIPKILHCIWIGGGDITQVKDLDGIQSWIDTQPDYQIWIWWDDSHMLNMHGVRNAISTASDGVASGGAAAVAAPASGAGSGGAGQVRRDHYEAERDDKDQKSALGRDIRNLRFLDWLRQQDRASLPEKVQAFLDRYRAFYDSRDNAGKHQGDQKLALALFLIDETAKAFEPLRHLQESNSDRVRLCNLRSHEFLPGAPGGTMNWMNSDLYNREMAYRGIFPAAASDILRYEILYNYGGIYLDVDLQFQERLGQLTVEENLARCAVEEDAKGTPRGDSSEEYHQKTAKTHGGKCFYAMNNIVATHKGSRFADLLRKCIRYSYDEMDQDGDRIVKRYWKDIPNKATIDLTGPNLVREIQYCLYKGFSPRDIPEKSYKRLEAALKKHEAKMSEKHFDTIADLQRDDFPRFAKIWRDDDKRYVAFWNWVWAHTYFPMEKVNWHTPAAAQSDTKAAAQQ